MKPPKQYVWLIVALLVLSSFLGLQMWNLQKFRAEAIRYYLSNISLDLRKVITSTEHLAYCQPENRTHDVTIAVEAGYGVIITSNYVRNLIHQRLWEDTNWDYTIKCIRLIFDRFADQEFPEPEKRLLMAISQNADLIDDEITSYLNSPATISFILTGKVPSTTIDALVARADSLGQIATAFLE